MDILEKLSILSSAAKYDVSCASSGSARRGRKGGLGNASTCGICHSWADDGRCISLLKILFSNHCIYDCAYCVNRASNSVPRASFTADEVVDLTMNFYRRNYIEGLFLSSGVMRSPAYTMEQLILVAEKLRKVHNFNGYIHMKAIPGAPLELITRAGFFCDRLSVNIELPSEKSLKAYAPQKKRNDILVPMSKIHSGIAQFKAERKKTKKAPLYVPAGQSTQLIVGASPESDSHILNLSESLYGAYRLKRVYYSAYMPVNDLPSFTGGENPDLLREHRLYQADWLVRLYGFSSSELFTEQCRDLDRELDPKTIWALRNPQIFPVDVNTAEYEMLLRIPGIGFRSAQKIISARRFSSLREEDLMKLGAVMKRARFFITCGGRPLERASISSPDIRLRLLGYPAPGDIIQPDLFAAGG